jgi:Protein of unknown function (DUF2587)
MTPNEPAPPTERERVRPEVMPDGGEPPAEGGEVADTEQITQPTKLIRIASMVRSMLDEVRRAPLDDAGRKALREIHEKSVDELEGVISPDLRSELEEMQLPFSSETPSESELRLAQAQLVGWLEGLFHGIQAAMFAQQMAARQQFEEIRRRGLMAQNPQGPEGPQGPQEPPQPGSRPGQYL